MYRKYIINVKHKKWGKSKYIYIYMYKKNKLKKSFKKYKCVNK